MTALAMALLVAAARMPCATCHRPEATSQVNTSMAHALESVADCRILRAHPKLAFRDGKYSYAIRREGERSIYSATDGSETITEPVKWVFGNGAAGQTYVYEHEGSYYESRVSFYNSVGGLDLTMGAATAAPADLEQAAGRKMDLNNVRECLNCHATGAARGNTLTLDTLAPGVQCERCHGETARHLATFTGMRKLSEMTTEETSNFCGGCHRTWEDITTKGPHGIVSVRFQPYRLTNSKCYDAGDKRIACTACHDPHEEVVHEAAFYDAKCIACHSVQGRSSTCPTASRNCVTCHMPKTELPGAHFAFTDHLIRVVKAGERYPE
jgi:hypothetical protein